MIEDKYWNYALPFQKDADAGVLPTHYRPKRGKPVDIALMSDEQLRWAWIWWATNAYLSTMYKALQREKVRRRNIRRQEALALQQKSE